MNGLECVGLRKSQLEDALLFCYCADQIQDSKNGRRLLRSKFDGAETFQMATESNRAFVDSFKRMLGEEPRSQKRSSKSRDELLQPEDAPPAKSHKGDEEEVMNKFVGSWSVMCMLD